VNAALRRWLALWREHAGWPGNAALLALLAALVLDQALTRPWRAQAEALFSEAAARPRSPAPGGDSAAIDPSAALPPAQAAAARSAALRERAAQHRVVLTRSSERRADGGALQLQLSASAPYPALRAFVADALAADPALVLDRVRLQRPTAEAPELEAELQWTLLQARSTAAAAGTPR
jgi:hypothetical protein